MRSRKSSAKNQKVSTPIHLRSGTARSSNLHDQRDRVIDRIQLEYPQYYSIRYQEPELNIDDVRAGLAGTSKAIISYYFDDEGGHAFYLSPGTFRHAAFEWDDRPHGADQGLWQQGICLEGRWI